MGLAEADGEDLLPLEEVQEAILAGDGVEEVEHQVVISADEEEVFERHVPMTLCMLCPLKPPDKNLVKNI